MIQGHQINENSIVNNKIKILTDTITTNNNVTNKDYVRLTLAQNKLFYYNKLNLNMLANDASIGELACNIPIIEFPISTVIVKLNGTMLTVGENKDCYFTPDADGIIIRPNDQIIKGDYLYWNNENYNLESDDELDFVYMTGYYYTNATSGSTIYLSAYNNAVVKFNGTNGDTLTINFNGNIRTMSIVDSDLVFDLNGNDEHTFSTNNEKISVTINTKTYDIWCDNITSKIFSIIEI